MIKAFQFQVTLNDVEPRVMRKFIIPAETTFLRLHDTLQFVMGWSDSHLFDFRGTLRSKQLEIVFDEDYYDEFQWRLEQYKERIARGETLHEFDERWFNRARETVLKKASSYKLTSYFKNVGDEITYRYDFGDDWEHTLILETIMEQYPVGYPMLLECDGACPPEDVGGSGGYEYFLEAWHDPKHPEHKEMRTWGESIYVEKMDVSRTNFLMSEILKLKIIKK